MARIKKQHPQAKVKKPINSGKKPINSGKKPINSGGKQSDISDDYDAFFPIYSEDEGKQFCSLVKRKISMPKYFDDRLLDELEMKDFIDNLCARMGWLQLKTIKYVVFFELIVEFYTTLKIIDEKLGIFSCRFYGKEYLFDYELSMMFLDFLREVFVNLHQIIT